MREHTRTILSRLGPASFETLILALLVIAGIGFVSGAPKPGSVNAIFPIWLLDIWGWTLLSGALLALAGLLAGMRLVHAAGMWLIAWVAAFYAIALLAHHAPGSLLQVVTDIALSVACVYRAVGLQRRHQ